MRLMLVALFVLVTPPTFAGASSIDRELLRRVLVTAHPDVARCSLPPERYLVRLTVEGDGRVTEVSVAEPLEISDEHATCVTRAFSRLRFPSFDPPRPPRPPRPAPREGEPRSHLPPAPRLRVGTIVVNWPFVVRAPRAIAPRGPRGARP